MNQVERVEPATSSDGKTSIVAYLRPETALRVVSLSTGAERFEKRQEEAGLLPLRHERLPDLLILPERPQNQKEKRDRNKEPAAASCGGGGGGGDGGGFKVGSRVRLDVAKLGRNKKDGKQCQTVRIPVVDDTEIAVNCSGIDLFPYVTAVIEMSPSVTAEIDVFPYRCGSRWWTTRAVRRSSWPCRRCTCAL